MWILCPGPARTAMIILSTCVLLYLTFIAAWPNTAFDNMEVFSKPREGINITRAKEVLSAMCAAYEKHRVSGDLCTRLCSDRDWTVIDYHERNKVVIVLNEGDNTTVLKSAHPSIADFKQLDKDYKYDEFVDKMLNVVNEELQLGWPSHYKSYLIEFVWPSILRSPGKAMSKQDMASVWMLLQQPEFVVFRMINLAQITPKIIGTCGHFYQPEAMVPFKMKAYNKKMKNKVLLHAMATLKLLDYFLNDPLHWCDVRVENLALSADYPDKFVLIDGDLLYTESRLNSLLHQRTCKSDADCTIGNCLSRCQANSTCSKRSNTNIDVFCDKLANKLFGHLWPKKNLFLVACHDTSNNPSLKLRKMKRAWWHADL